MRAFTQMWDELTETRYGVTDPTLRRFRYGVQVNSLGLSAAQPENNAWRIAIECLGVTLSRRARCRALQLPAWNEALSLPREWDQQWMIRLQQILAYETDLLEYPDLFDGSPVIASKVGELIDGATAEIERILALGGVENAVDSGYLKSALVKSMTDRIGAIDRGDQCIVGVNRWTDGLPSPLVSGQDGGLFAVNPDATQEALAALTRTRKARDPGRVTAALEQLTRAARDGTSMMEPSIECAHARVTTGEWADALREVFGEYRAPTGVGGQSLSLDSSVATELARRVAALAKARGRRPRLVVAKPGLDGHSNGAEVIAVAGRQSGFDVVYGGIRLSCQAIAESAVEEDADLIGLSILSGSHLELCKQLISALEGLDAADIPVVVGGIIPQEDHDRLRAMGVAQIFTPRDSSLGDVMTAIVDLIEAQ
jgi:(2R)-ethylmalonyl-CoA mutase